MFLQSLTEANWIFKQTEFSQPESNIGGKDSGHKWQVRLLDVGCIVDF